MKVKVAALLLGAACSQPVWAQTAPTDELKAQLEAARKMIKDLEQRVQQLEKEQAAKQAKPAAPLTAPAPAAAAPPEAPQQPGLLGRIATSGYQPPIKMRGDEVGEPRLDNAPVDPEMKGFFRLPATQTLIRFGGYTKLDAIYDLKPIGTFDSFITSAIPTGPPASNFGKHFTMHAKQTRFNTDFLRPTEFGVARLFGEVDLFGDQSFDFDPGTYQFHLRHAYGQVANFGAGFTYTTFMDADALPDTLDFEGPGSAPFLFTPELRYTYAFNPSFLIAGAIEGPRSDITTLAGSIATERAPDIALRARYEAEKGHIQLSGVFRRLTYTDGSGAGGNANGTGLQLSGSWQIFGADYLVASGIYGKGIARYISDISGLGLDAIVNPSGGLTALTAKGGYVGYTHYWTPKLRSTGVAGVLSMDNEDFQPGNAFKQSQYYSANLIWTPYGTLSLGLEVLFGSLEVFDGSKGDASRIQLSVQYDFVR